MKISKSGIDFIHQFEGLRLKAYKVLESERYYTIGWGHYGQDVKFGQEISRQRADDLFDKDIDRFQKAVNLYVKVDINQNQFDALVSFAYNVGISALQTSTLLEKLNKGDYVGASKEFARWNKSGGKVLAGLTKRREKERQLFMKDFKEPTKVKPPTKPTPAKSPQTATYTVKSGDTLSEIAVAKKTTVAKLLKLNPSIKDKDTIYVGQKIKYEK